MSAMGGYGNLYSWQSRASLNLLGNKQTLLKPINQEPFQASRMSRAYRKLTIKKSLNPVRLPAPEMGLPDFGTHELTGAGNINTGLCSLVCLELWHLRCYPFCNFSFLGDLRQNYAQTVPFHPWLFVNGC